MTPDGVKKTPWAIPVPVVDGEPLCPHCLVPMRDHGDGTYDCAVIAPLWEQLTGNLAAALDRRLSR